MSFLFRSEKEYGDYFPSAEREALKRENAKLKADYYELKAELALSTKTDDEKPIVTVRRMLSLLSEFKESCLTTARNLEAIQDDLIVIRSEVERLLAGDFTPEEFQNLCHKFSEKDKAAFCNGCEAYQKKLFGSSPITKLKETLKEAQTFIKGKFDEYAKEMGKLDAQSAFYSEDYSWGIIMDKIRKTLNETSNR